MKITDAMLWAAVKQAVEEGLLPKAAAPEEYVENAERVRRVLEAAIDAREDQTP